MFHFKAHNMKLIAFILALFAWATPAQAQVQQTFQSAQVDLFRNWSRISGLTQDVCVIAPAHVFMQGLLNLRHRNLVTGPVGWALKAGVRYETTLQALGPKPTSANPGAWATTPGFQWINGALSSGNIRDIEHHYSEANLSGYFWASVPGCYRIEWWGTSHSSLGPNTDGLITTNTGASLYNHFVTRVQYP